MLTITTFRSFESASAFDYEYQEATMEMASNISIVASCLHNFVIEEDGDVHIVPRDGEEGEQIDPMEGAPDSLGYGPSGGTTTIVHGNPLRRHRIVNVLMRILNETLWEARYHFQQTITALSY